MELDRNLLKEFAEITNDSEVKSETKYLRGTIVSNSGGKYVQLDGSSTATPISEVVDVEEGDRVLVTIENHKATIVGNFTFPPSARKEQEAIDKADTAQESADNANTTANVAQEKAQSASDKADTAISQSSIASASADEAKSQATEAIIAANSASANASEAKTLATQANTNSSEAKDLAAASQAASAEAQAEVTRLNAEVTAAQEDIDSVLEDLETQASEIAGIKETYATKVEVGNTKAELETTITKKVGELETTISETYSTKTENVELEGKLQSQITQNAEGLTSQATKIEKLESDTTEAQKDVADALAKADAAQTAANEAQSKVDEAKAAADAASADAATATEKANLAQNAADAAQAAADAADKSVQEAQSDLNEAKQNLASVTSRVDATEADIADAQAKVDAAQTEVNNALADAAEANAAATKAQEAATKAQQDAETAQGVAATAQQKANNAQTAADNAQAAADKAQADVAALTSRVTKAETTISQNSENITLNASKTEEIGTRLDNLEIGGRNLIVLSTSRNGYRIAPDGENWGSTYSSVTEYIPVQSENVVTLTVYDVYEDEGDTYIQLAFYTEDKVIISRPISEVANFTDKKTSWQAEIPSDAYYMRASFPTSLSGKVKLEFGNKSTDWTPAPEDVDSNIDGVKTDLATNYYSKTETDALIKVESDRITSTVSRVETVEKGVVDAQTAADNAQADIDNLDIGGRNLLLGTKAFNELTYADSLIIDETYLDFNVRYLDKSTEEATEYGEVANFNSITPDPGGQYVFSFYAKGTGILKSYFFNGSYKVIETVSSQDVQSQSGDGDIDITLSEEWKRYWIKYTLKDENTLETSGDKTVLLRIFGGNVAYVCGAKLEKGNKATDWTPAPEDVNSDIENAQSAADNAQAAADNAQTTANIAQSTIQQLSDMISHLVTDANGTSLMTQTSDGWTFNMSSITGNLAAIQTAMENMETDQNDTNDALQKLTDLVDSVTAKTAYIDIGTDDNGDPCIELGKSDSAFKVRITNTAIDFLEGSSKIAYVNNNTFYSSKIITNEIQIGEGPGFIWRTRASGNMGLVYISG